MATTRKTATKTREPKTPEIEMKDEKEADVVPLDVKVKIPWHPKIEQMYGDLGINEFTWPALLEAMFPNCDDLNAILLALAYAKGRKFDPFKVRVYLVPYWTNIADKRAGEKDTWRKLWRVQNSVEDLRATAFRTGEYVGLSKVRWGPMIELSFSDQSGKVVSKLRVPSYAQHTVKRWVHGEARDYEGPEVYWEESYQKAGRNTGVPNEMWAKRQRGQLAKCSEAGALRTAFPEELGALMITEEMQIESDETRAEMATDVSPPGGPAIPAESTGEIIDHETAASEPSTTEPEGTTDTEPDRHTSEATTETEPAADPKAPEDEVDPFEYIDSNGECLLFTTPDAFGDKVVEILAIISKPEFLDLFLENNNGEIERLKVLGFTLNYQRCIDAIAQTRKSFEAPSTDPNDQVCASVIKTIQGITGRKAVDDYWTGALKQLKQKHVPDDKIEEVRKVYQEHRRAQTT